jgi:hypothetical protein
LDIVIERIIEEVKPVYLGSVFYSSTIWPHVWRVSLFAEDLALKMGANKSVAKIEGILHDYGAAKYGRENHHITGAQEATIILLKCGCPLGFIGPIASAIYSHRGSQRIAFETIEAKILAAADSLDHFTNLEELWRVQIEDRKIIEMEVYQTLAEKLERDYEKIDPEVKFYLDGFYEKAQEELLKIASSHKSKKP